MLHGESVTQPLDKPIILGRGIDESGNQLKIDLLIYGDGVSRNRAIIEFIDGKVCLTDNDRLNRTLLNGAELYSHRHYVIKSGDKVMLGKVEIQIRYNRSSHPHGIQITKP